MGGFRRGCFTHSFKQNGSVPCDPDALWAGDRQVGPVGKRPGWFGAISRFVAHPHPLSLAWVLLLGQPCTASHISIDCLLSPSWTALGTLSNCRDGSSPCSRGSPSRGYMFVTNDSPEGLERERPWSNRGLSGEENAT